MPHSHFHYLNHSLKRELSELYVSTLIRGFAIGMLALFTPLYFFKEGWTVQHIVLWFALNYTIFFFLAPLGAKATVRFGHEKAMALSMPIALVYYAMLFFLPTNPNFFWWSAVILGFHKSIFWVAYHSDFAKFGNKKKIGEEIGILGVMLGVIGVLSPAVGGFVVTMFGFQTLYLLGGLLMVASLLPMLITDEHWKPGKINLLAPYKMIVNKKFRSDVIGHIATGEDIVAQAIWPIWLFMIIPSYKDVGILTTITILIAFAIMLWIGKLSNHKKKSRLIKRSAPAVSFSWIARMFAFTPMGIFFTDAIYKISRKSLAIPYAALVYTRTSKKKIIEYTTFWMCALSIGKLIAALLIYIILTYTDNLVYTFLVSALLSLLFLVWRDTARA
ncbi:MAG: hypothetical protein CMI52_01635 [Parcubacteria group bacterium]|nr:hypothetical protein [Parcubacteria group bacterium]